MEIPGAPTSGLDAYVRGLTNAKKLFAAMPKVFRNRLNSATDLTLFAIREGAKARVLASPSVRTRRLHGAIDYKLSPSTGKGRVGVTDVAFPDTRRIDRPAKRAHFVELGTRKMPAEPFMVPATQAQEGPYLKRCQEAGQLAERDLAAGTTS